MMLPVDLLKLRWLRMIAVNDLRSEDYDLIMRFTMKYQQGKTPTFAEEEVASMGAVYVKARAHYLVTQRGIFHTT